MELELLNLEDLNLVEINAQEQKDIEGGLMLFLGLCGAIYSTGYVIGRVAHHLENS